MTHHNEIEIELHDTVGVMLNLAQHEFELGEIIGVRAKNDEIFALQVRHIIEKVDGSFCLMAFALPQEGAGLASHRLEKATVFSAKPLVPFTKAPKPAKDAPKATKPKEQYSEAAKKAKKDKQRAKLAKEAPVAAK